MCSARKTIVATTQAICDYRKGQGFDGPLFLGRDTHGLSEPAWATALEVLFSLHDIASLHADSPAAGLALLDNEAVDLVIQDMNFSADTTSGDEGRELFAAIRQRHPDLPVVLLTAWTHLESAVELIKAGAADYVAKPWQDAKLLATVNNLLELAEARRELDLRRDGERRRPAVRAGGLCRPPLRRGRLRPRAAGRVRVLGRRHARGLGRALARDHADLRPADAPPVRGRRAPDPDHGPV